MAGRAREENKSEADRADRQEEGVEERVEGRMKECGGKSGVRDGIRG